MKLGKDYAIGSGSTCEDHHGDPRIEVGSEIIIGYRSLDKPNTEWCQWIKQNAGKRMIVERKKRSRDISAGLDDDTVVSGFIPGRKHDEVSFFVHARDCVLIDDNIRYALRRLANNRGPVRFDKLLPGNPPELRLSRLCIWLRLAGIATEEANGFFVAKNKSRLQQLVWPLGRKDDQVTVQQNALVLIIPSEDGLSPEETDLHDNIDALHDWLWGALDVAREYWGPGETEVLRSMAACILASRRSITRGIQLSLEKEMSKIGSDADMSKAIAALIRSRFHHKRFGGGLAYDERTLSAYREQKARVLALAEARAR